MTFSPCPKPEKVVKAPPRWLPCGNPPKRKAWLARGRKPIPQVNRRAQARRTAHYGKVIRSDFNKELRWLAFVRSDGYCECDMCRDIRSLTMSKAAVGADAAEIERAHTPIPCWFTKKGGEPWRRFRSNDGELHHDSYKFFGDENPAELKYVRWVWKSCHKRIEAEHHTRRRFLRGTH